MPHPQKSIAEQGGIRVKLDDEAASHNGFGYDRFDLFCRLGLPNTVIMKLMGVRTVDTIKHWKQHRERLTSISK
jgi:hypothetical protein